MGGKTNKQTEKKQITNATKELSPFLSGLFPEASTPAQHFPPEDFFCEVTLMVAKDAFFSVPNWCPFLWIADEG